MLDDLEPGAAEHGFHAGRVRGPPVGRIIRIAMLDEVHLRVARIVEMLRLPEGVVLLDGKHVLRPALHRLEHEHVPGHVLVDEIERQERMPQVVENAHEKHHVEALAERSQVVDGELAELDVMARGLSREAGLGEIRIVEIDAQNPARPALLHLDRVEAAVAADVEHGFARQVLRDRARELLPFDRRIITEKMVGSGPNAVQLHVVEPGTQGFGPLADLIGGCGVDSIHGGAYSLLRS
jgi:hypothetical protein